MGSEMKYSANLTGAAFMFFEFKKVVLLKKQFTDKEIRKKIIDDNIFQYAKNIEFETRHTYNHTAGECARRSVARNGD